MFCNVSRYFACCFVRSVSLNVIIDNEYVYTAFVSCVGGCYYCCCVVWIFLFCLVCVCVFLWLLLFRDWVWVSISWIGSKSCVLHFTNYTNNRFNLFLNVCFWSNFTSLKCLWVSEWMSEYLFWLLLLLLLLHMKFTWILLQHYFKFNFGCKYISIFHDSYVTRSSGW